MHDRLAGSSGNFIATSCNVQRRRATCNAATVAAKYFYLYFIAPVGAAAIYLPDIARLRPQPRRNQRSFLLHPLPSSCSSCSSAALYGAPPVAVYVFSFILSPQLGLGLGPAACCPGHKFKFNAGEEGRRRRRAVCRHCINYDLVDFYDKP